MTIATPTAPGTSVHVEDALRGKLVLPMIPRVVRSAMTLLRDPRTGPRELADELSPDPVLCARVLRLANSPFYGGRRTVASIEDAVSAVGMQALGTLLVASGVSAAFVEVPGVHLRDYWLHAAVAAAAARTLARRVGADGEAAYLAGLLHEGGHLILCQAFAEAARGAFGQQLARHGQALADAEQAVFGASHPQISAMWCRSLQLPDAVTDAVAHYLAPPEGEPGRLASILHLAGTLAAAIGVDETAEDALRNLDPARLSQARLDVPALSQGFAEQYATLRQAGSSF